MLWRQDMGVRWGWGYEGKGFLVLAIISVNGHQEAACLRLKCLACELHWDWGSSIKICESLLVYPLPRAQSTHDMIEIIFLQSNIQSLVTKSGKQTPFALLSLRVYPYYEGIQQPRCSRWCAISIRYFEKVAKKPIRTSPDERHSTYYVLLKISIDAYWDWDTITIRRDAAAKEVIERSTWFDRSSMMADDMTCEHDNSSHGDLVTI